MLFSVLHQHQQCQGLPLFVKQLTVKHSFNFWYIFAALHRAMKEPLPCNSCWIKKTISGTGLCTLSVKICFRSSRGRVQRLTSTPWHHSNRAKTSSYLKPAQLNAHPMSSKSLSLTKSITKLISIKKNLPLSPSYKLAIAS